MICIKCSLKTNIKKLGGSNYICEDCKIHEKVVKAIYEESKNVFMDPSQNIESTDIFELLKNTYFIVQKNPKLSVYPSIIRELLEDFAVKDRSEVDYDDLWRRTKSTRNILRILESMEKANIIKIESPDKIRRIIKPDIIIKRFIESAYKPFKTQDQVKIRVAAVLAMYLVLHEMYVLANAETRDEILKHFGPHTPKAPWVATMFLWTERLRKDIDEKGSSREFSEEDIRDFLRKRGLSSVTISNYIAALRATSPHSLQQYIENIQPTGDTIKFIVKEEFIRTVDRIYRRRVRELDRA